MLWCDIGSVRGSNVRPVPEGHPHPALPRAPRNDSCFSLVQTTRFADDEAHIGAYTCERAQFFWHRGIEELAVSEFH